MILEVRARRSIPSNVPGRWAPAGITYTILGSVNRKWFLPVEMIKAPRLASGYSQRPISGRGAGKSNHAAGLAVDINGRRR